MGAKSPTFRKYVLYLFSFKMRVKQASIALPTSCGIFWRSMTKNRLTKTKAYLANFHDQKNLVPMAGLW